MKRRDRAVSYFDEGFSCAQAVLATFAPQFGLTTEQAMRVAGSFGSGMAGRGQTCGAVTGAMMVIGLQEGKTRGDDDAARDQCYAVVDAFVTRFEGRHGSIVCRELLGCDISTPEGMAHARENNLFDERCTTFVRDAADILTTLLE
ncbi:MAG TPA: C_GCAxxG_C_C family protein [Chloroflexi bacterium]|nr:C_GCAxxG_C_C family protein [Chloroflexota bacterium]